MGKGSGNVIEGGSEGKIRTEEHFEGSKKPSTLKTSYNIQR